MKNKKIPFQLEFPENIKRKSNLPATDRLAFDDLGDFVEERERIKRLLETRTNADLKVDYSDFSNHVFFDEAESKLNIGISRILNKLQPN